MDILCIEFLSMVVSANLAKDSTKLSKKLKMLSGHALVGIKHFLRLHSVWQMLAVHDEECHFSQKFVVNCLSCWTALLWQRQWQAISLHKLVQICQSLEEQHHIRRAVAFL